MKIVIDTMPINPNECKFSEYIGDGIFDCKINKEFNNTCKLCINEKCDCLKENKSCIK